MIIPTMHIRYDIKNQPDLVRTFQLCEQQAREKRLLLYCGKNFYIRKIGQSVGAAPLFETDDLGAMMQFIARAKE